MKNLLYLVIISFLFLNCTKSEKKASEEKIAEDSSAIKAIEGKSFAEYVKTLGSDEFMGRKPFTPGEEKTINYLKEQFSSLGLQPGNNGSFFQQVPMAEIESSLAAPLEIKGKGGKVSLKYLDDYVASTRRVADEVKVENSEMVFAGFGIVAPEYNWNDFEGLDVKGKTVIVMVNDPGFYDSTLFKGKTMTYYGRWTYKYEEAARHGAAALMIIHDTAPASYPWKVVRGGWSGKKLNLQSKDNNMGRAAIEGWFSTESANKIFKLAGVKDDLLSLAKKKGFKPVSLGLTYSITLKNSIKKSTSNNVIAVYPGSERKDEYIIYTAHWDHFGIGEKVDGDSIYNGAVDNATGVASLLELGSAFSKLRNKPLRSIVFLAVTGEEEGLLGSEYYSVNPVFPLNKTIADINVDALNPIGRTKDIAIIGNGHSEMDEYLSNSAKKQGRTVALDANPSAGYFFRSDHFNFAKVGVPALYIETGKQSLAHPGNWAVEQSESYTRERYHSPKDEFDEATWDMSGMVEDVRLLFDIGLTLSNETKYPAWKEGSEFKEIREKSLGKQ